MNFKKLGEGIAEGKDVEALRYSEVKNISLLDWYFFHPSAYALVYYAWPSIMFILFGWASLYFLLHLDVKAYYGFIGVFCLIYSLYMLFRLKKKVDNWENIKWLTFYDVYYSK